MEGIISRQLLASNINCLPPWLPVSVFQIKLLIQSLKNDKAPGEDFLPSELFKTNIDWWATLMAGLFTQMNKTGCVPKDWKLSIIVTINKEVGQKNPKNYRPITLIDIPVKIYAKYLLQKEEDYAPLAKEPIGFRRSRSILDNFYILHHLITKYTKKNW